MKQYLQKLNEYLINYVPNYGDPEIETMLEFLWAAYTQENPICSDAIKQRFAALEPIWDALSLEDADRLCQEVSGLCCEHERLAFLSGLQVGAKLAAELA